MSWSPDFYIGEMRPWPDAVHVVRGKTDESRRYFPDRKDVQEDLCARIDELCARVEALKREMAYRELDKCLQCSIIDALLKSQAENVKLRELVCDLYYETKSPSNHATQVEMRMSELGIEVNE